MVNPPPYSVALLPAPSQPIEPELSRDAQHRWGAFSARVAMGWALAFAMCVGLGYLVTDPLRDSSLLRWDRQLPEEVASSRTPTGETWSSYGSLLGDTLTVVGIALLVGVVLLTVRRWASVMLLATALLAEVTIFVTSTIVVPRDRPDVNQLDVSPPTSSFPSGHTAAATALMLSLAVIVGWNVRSTLVRVIAWIVAIVAGPIVGISRVYRGMHHPLDVIVGLGLGVACVALAFFAVRAFVGNDELDRAQDQTADGRSGSHKHSLVNHDSRMAS